VTATRPPQSRTGLGIALMICVGLVFAVQDGVSRYLASEYNVLMVVMIRYWFFAAFVIALARRGPGGLRATASTAMPVLQVFRGAMLALQICAMVTAFTLLGLVEAHAVFACYPLLIAALSGPVLGERVGWRRWVAIAVGFVGVLIILDPTHAVFSNAALIPLVTSAMFALYGLLTRYAARQDSPQTSFFWTGVAGAGVMTLIGVWHWEVMSLPHYGVMACLCVTGVTGHWLLIKCYDVAEASAVQPFAYFQMVFAGLVGIVAFGDVLRSNTIIGASIVVAAGLFALIRARQVSAG
jgi:drug/metabolite transporter (DMT)-like permease